MPDTTKDTKAEAIEKKARLREKLGEKISRALPEVLKKKDRLPPGQHLVTSFPVLDLGIRPPIDTSTYRFRVEGEVENPINLSWEEFMALPKAIQVSDFHCVTTWSKYDVKWGGVRLKTLVDLVRPTARATHLIQACGDEYTTNLPLSELTGQDIMIAYELEGQPLSLEHGGPVRMVVPHLYAWKSSKFLNRLIFQDHDTPGFWEVRGYHNRGCPWKEERFG